MKLGLIGAFISVMAVMAILGGMAWSFYTSPSSVALESEGLKMVIDIERQSVLEQFSAETAD